MTSPTTDRREGLNSSAAIKVPVRVATTANLPLLAGLLTIDGVVLAAGDRVLVKNQANTVNNGIYDADTGNWTRSIDFDGVYDSLNGTIVNVTEGATDARTVWRLVATNPVVFGTSQITFTPLLSAPLGTTTNDDAAPGRVGEVISSAIAFPGVSLLATGPKTVTSILLTPGDWDLGGTVNFSTAGGSSFTQFVAGYSTVNNTLPGDQLEIKLTLPPVLPAGASTTLSLPLQRASLAVATTYFLVAQATFTIGTAGAYCNFLARRRR